MEEYVSNPKRQYTPREAAINEALRGLEMAYTNTERWADVDFRGINAGYGTTPREIRAVQKQIAKLYNRLAKNANFDFMELPELEEKEDEEQG